MDSSFVPLWLVLLVSAICAPQALCRLLDGRSMAHQHEQWMVQYGRQYRDEAEKAARFRIFQDNAEYIESVNRAGDRKYELGLNAFADQTNDEFKSTRNGFRRRQQRTRVTKTQGGFMYENVTEVPSSMDWRTSGAVTPIKDQGQCGCCWAFSAVAAVEGINKLKTGQLVSLSEQELVDCDVSGEDQGCGGGLMDDAFQFIIDNRGIAAESSYPYRGVDGTCSSARSNPPVASIGGYEDVPANSEVALLKAVAHQPVSVAIDAGERDFQLYKSGVFTGSCGTNLDHGVTAVGYGTQSDGTKYWLVKNSWGTSWGENGYIRMERDVSDEEGLCGIAMDASFPTA